MTDTNVIFNNNSLDEEAINEGEFRIGEDDSTEYSFSDEAKEKSVENYNNEEFEMNPVEELTNYAENNIDEENEELVEEEEEGEMKEAEENAKEEKLNDDVVVISKSKVVLIEKLLKNIKENNDKVIQLLSGSISSEDEARISIGQISDDSFTGSSDEVDDSRIIEGVFDGESMIGPDGKQYSMPANYASKSKLIEGDIMKLTITDSGTFVYKQIGPIDRRRVIGIINQVDNGNFIVVDEETGQKWRVLTASVTYYKGQAGDEAVILVPKNGESKWAAVDNVVRRQE